MLIYGTISVTIDLRICFFSSFFFHSSYFCLRFEPIVLLYFLFETCLVLWQKNIAKGARIWNNTSWINEILFNSFCFAHSSLQNFGVPKIEAFYWIVETKSLVLLVSRFLDVFYLQQYNVIILLLTLCALLVVGLSRMGMTNETTQYRPHAYCILRIIFQLILNVLCII